MTYFRVVPLLLILAGCVNSLDLSHPQDDQGMSDSDAILSPDSSITDVSIPRDGSNSHDLSIPTDSHIDLLDTAIPPDMTPPECTPGQIQPCTNDCGDGERSCVNGRWSLCAVIGMAEACNGSDDDCDGSIDEGFNLGQPCEVGEGICQQQGVIICANERSACSVQPLNQESPETCNGIDDDCDGWLDEGQLCPSGPHQSGVCVDGACRMNCESNWLDRDGQPGNGCERGCDRLAPGRVIASPAMVEPPLAITSAGLEYVIGYINDSTLTCFAPLGSEEWDHNEVVSVSLAVGSNRIFGAITDDSGELWSLEFNTNGSIQHTINEQPHPNIGPTGIAGNPQNSRLVVAILNGDQPNSSLKLARSDANQFTQYSTYAIPGLKSAVPPVIVPWLDKWLVVVVATNNGQDTLQAHLFTDLLIHEANAAIPPFPSISGIGVAHRPHGQNPPEVAVAAISDGNRMIFGNVTFNNDRLSFPGSNNQIAAGNQYAPDISVIATPSGWAVIFRDLADQAYAWIYEGNLALPVRPELGPAPHLQATGDGRFHHATFLRGNDIIYTSLNCE